MKFSKIVCLFLVVLLLTISAGCNTGDRETGGQNINNPSPGVSEKTREITDPEELEKIWQEYLFDTIANVGNVREFNSAEDLAPELIAEYAYVKHVTEHGKESLDTAGGESMSRLLPLEVAQDYAKRYFNLTNLDVSELEEHIYDPEHKAFLFGIQPQNTRPTYDSGGVWGYKLAQVTRGADSTITAVMVRPDFQHKERIELTVTYILKERPDGTLYFVAGRWDYVDNNLVSITGDHLHFDEIKGFTGHMFELSMLGELDGKVILAHIPYVTGQTSSILLVDPTKMEVIKKLDMQHELGLSDMALKAEKIVAYLPDKILVYDKNLEQQTEIPLPAEVKEIIARELKYDQNGMPDVFFGGYDVSTDFQQLVYADEIGLKLYNLADNTEKLLSPVGEPVKGDRLVKFYPHNAPRFVAADSKVISTLLAYEGTMGYVMCDLASGEVKKYEISSEASSTAFIRYDTGILEVNTYLREAEGNKTLYLDFASGEVKEIKLENMRDTGYIRSHDQNLVGQNYAAFLNQYWNSDDYTESLVYLNRLNLKTFEVETNLITVKAAQTHILGVLADGRLLFWYDLNPSERGVCITGVRL